MQLTEDEAKAPAEAADRTRAQVSVAHLNGEGRELVAAVSRMQPTALAVLRRKLLKSYEEDFAFRRKLNGVSVPPNSHNIIMKVADDFVPTFSR